MVCTRLAAASAAIRRPRMARRDDRNRQADQDGEPERDQREEHVLGEIIGQEAQRVGGPLIHARSSCGIAFCKGADALGLAFRHSHEGGHLGGRSDSTAARAAYRRPGCGRRS